MTPAPLHLQFDVACPVEHAFAVWTERIDSWWPADHTVSSEPDLTVVLEPRVVGRIYERTAAGLEHEWGETTVWGPPYRLGYRWHLRRDRDDATDVEIRFRRGRRYGDASRHHHSGWERLGAGGADWRERNQAGWDTLWPHYVKGIERHG